MKQKITLIGALIVDPDILILDEPMVGLDAKSSYNLKKIMRERCDRGKSVFSQLMLWKLQKIYVTL